MTLEWRDRIDEVATELSMEDKSMYLRQALELHMPRFEVTYWTERVEKKFNEHISSTTPEGIFGEMSWSAMSWYLRVVKEAFIAWWRTWVDWSLWEVQRHKDRLDKEHKQKL